MTAATRDLVLRAPKTGPWIIGYAVTLGLSFSLFYSGTITDPRIGALVWIPIAICTAMMVWTSWRRHRLLGTVSDAVRAFWRRGGTRRLRGAGAGCPDHQLLPRP